MSRCFRSTVSLCGALCVLLFVDPPAAAAQEARRGLADYTVTTWNESDGLYAGGITAIAQDGDGYLWIGTDAGLVRFDGVRFQPVRGFGETHQPFESITALLSARDRSLWIGVGRSGIVRFRQGRFTTYSTQDGFEGFTNSLLEDREGTIWAGSSRGLFQFDGERWHAAGRGLKDDAVLAMHEDGAGRFWVATRNAVLRSGGPQGRFESLGAIELSSNIWQSFSEDADGVVWVSDFKSGFRRADTPPAPMPRQRGWGVRMIRDRRGDLWVATRGQGVWRLQQSQSGALVPDRITAKDGLANDAVQSVFEDREGNIWLGTNAGLQRLTPHRVIPLTDLTIARSAAVTSDGGVWVGTTIGLFRLSGTSRRQYQEADGLPGVVALALAADARGSLWFATERALARFDGEAFTTVLTLTGERRVFAIAAVEGSVWTRDVNLRLNRIAETGEPLPVDVPEEFRTRVFTVAADRRGGVWIGTVDGRLGVRDARGRFRSFAPDIGSIASIFADESNVIWVGGEQGLGRIEGDRLTTVTRRNGLPSGVAAIVEEPGGALWVGLRSGIARIEPDDLAKAAASPDYQLRFRLFNSADGAAGTPVTAGGRTAVRSPDGRLWFATSGGVTLVDPRLIGDPKPAVPVLIESVVADKVEFPLTSDLDLPARTSHVQFAFTSLTLTDPMRVQFQYRLEGLDKDWVNAGSSRQASYTNLGPGHYRFLLRGTSGDASWSAPGASLDFWIQPTFYQTNWFYALSVVALLSIAYGVWWLNARRVRTQFALVLGERIRMSRAIHDTLLQGLAGLALQLDDLSHGFDTPSPTLKQRVLQMRRRVEESIRDARQSIWDLRSPALESKPFPEVLRDVGLRAINGRPIAFEFQTAGTPRPCSPAVQEQLLRICQEAVTNAVRHARPQHVDVQLEYTSSAVRVRVRDDGCGFDPSGVNGTDGHHGVITMKERAAQVRGRLTIASAPGEGTQVETVVPPM